MNPQDYINNAISTLQADSRFKDVDMSSSSAFFNLRILPFALMSKPLFDLKDGILNALSPDSMSESQMDTYGKLFFVDRPTSSYMTLQVQILLSLSLTTSEPLTVLTTDEFRTSNNEVFNPVEDYIFAYDTLPTLTLSYNGSSTQYKVATILTTTSNNNYSAISDNAIKTTTVTHPLLAGVTNTQPSSAPVSSTTNSDFLTFIENSFNVKDNSDSDAIYSNLKKAYPNITDFQTIGYGDVEMQRDIAVAGKDWSGHFGGMVDSYIKTPILASSFVASANPNANNTGFTFTLQAYRGLNWTDTVNPLTPWTKLSGTTPLLPVVLFDWEHSTIDGYTFKLDDTGEIKYEVTPVDKNYRFSPYESLSVTVYVNEAVTGSKSINLKYYTLTSLDEINSFLYSNRNICQLPLARSFVPIEIKELRVVYNGKYSVDTATWAQNLADIINGWSSSDPLTFPVLFNGFPAPIRLDEVWHDKTNLPYTFDENGSITGVNGSPSSDGYPTFAKVIQSNIDGTKKTYITTKQLYPVTISNGLSASLKTCRYFIVPENITFEIDQTS